MWGFKYPQRTTPTILPNIPPKDPSIVFFGLTLGHNLCFPKFFPIYYANVSQKNEINKTSHIKLEPYSCDLIGISKEKNSTI